MENALDVSEESGEHIDEEGSNDKAEVAEGSGHKSRGIKPYSQPKTKKVNACTTYKGQRDIHPCVISMWKI